MVLCALEDSRRLVVANIGDSALIVLRPVPYQNSKLSKEYRSVELRYEARRPKQLVRLDQVSVEDIHLVIQGAHLGSLECQPGDMLVIGSDGIFDNLKDEEIIQIVEDHCMRIPTFSRECRNNDRSACGERPPVSMMQLEATAEALVSAAIDNVQPSLPEKPPKDAIEAAQVAQRELSGGNADDTTVLVATVVEATRMPSATRMRHVAKEFEAFEKSDPAASLRNTQSWTSGLDTIFPQCCRTGTGLYTEDDDLPFQRDRFHPGSKTPASVEDLENSSMCPQS